MKKDNIIRNAVKNRNKEIRHRVYKLSYIWWSVGILFVAVVLLVLSFILYNSFSWLSNVLISTSCGCITGSVLYFLVNIRNNKARKLQEENYAIQQTLNILRNILGFGNYYKLTQPDEPKLSENINRILDFLDELEEARNRIDSSVYDVVYSKGYDPLDRKNINYYREQLNAEGNAESKIENIIQICKELTPASNKLLSLLQERNDQISFMNHSFL